MDEMYTRYGGNMDAEYIAEKLGIDSHIAQKVYIRLKVKGLPTLPQIARRYVEDMERDRIKRVLPEISNFELEQTRKVLRNKDILSADDSEIEMAYKQIRRGNEEIEVKFGDTYMSC